MPEYLAPGVYVEETSFRAKSIEGVATSTAGFVGQAHVAQLLQSARARLATFQVQHLLQSEGDVPRHGPMGEQVELLEDHAHARAGRVQVGVDVGEFPPLEEDLPFGGLFEQVDRA